MLEVKGKYSSAKIFATHIEETALQSVEDLSNQEWTKSAEVAYMPDVHNCGDCNVGCVVRLHEDKVNPRLLGSDFACGMLTVKFKGELDFKKLDSVISTIPTGFSVYEEPKYSFEHINEFIAPIDKHRSLCALGTLGGGNHFIEVDKDDEDNLYLVIHTGCRSLGSYVLKHYVKSLKKVYLNGLTYDETVKQAKAEWKAKGLLIKDMAPEFFKNLKEEFKEASQHIYIQGQQFKDFIHDVHYAQLYATQNREIIANTIIKGMGWEVEDKFETIHNYIDMDTMTLRKGAIRANKGEKVLVPLNMKDGSLICEGLGNEEALCSCNHGAGRSMSRKQAKDSLSLNQFKEEMKDIYSSTVQLETLDEAPEAYKDVNILQEDMKPLVKVLKHIKPLYNFKGI